MFKNFLITLSSLGLIFINGTMYAGEIVSEQFISSTTNDIINATFSEKERQTISEYFNKHSTETEDEPKKQKKSKGKGKSKGLPPGLARKEHLPPGLEKQLQRNGTLPPGLAKRDLPADLTSSLPPVQDGMERVIADSHVVLVEKASGIIRDIIEDIVQ
ncbi:MAG: hypothetical protein EP297_10990 [Gammaproteobacteria bacterium]|nr:MAG: hypothetical protein EP297_10990 [Gammaproteobacteria bacterium]